ncbi:hypothetical protein D3C85_1851920 [compost metagenome]
MDVQLEANSVTSTMGEGDSQVSITLPLAPGKTADLYRNNRAQLPQELFAQMNAQTVSYS